MAVVDIRNRTNAGLGLGGDAGDNGLAIMGAGNRMDAGLALRENVRDDGLVVIDNVLAARDDELAVDNDGSAAKIGKRMDINDRLDVQAGNQADTRPGNRPDTDLMMTTTDDIRIDLIKDFNNSILVFVSAKLSCIVPDKHAMDSSVRILVNVIHNPFKNLTPLSLALPFSPLLLFLPAPTTCSNFGNIPITFIYFILI